MIVNLTLQHHHRPETVRRFLRYEIRNYSRSRGVSPRIVMHVFKLDDIIISIGLVPSTNIVPLLIVNIITFRIGTRAFIVVVYFTGNNSRKYIKRRKSSGVSGGDVLFWLVVIDRIGAHHILRRFLTDTFSPSLQYRVCICIRLELIQYLGSFTDEQ